MMNLYMVILGCNLPNRYIEQHDVFFNISDNLLNLKQSMYDFWPEAGEKLHIDSYRAVSRVGNYEIKIIDREKKDKQSDLKLYFLNLGGYKPDDMEEYHYKQLVVAKSIEEAIAVATENAFYQHHTEPHVDNKYGIDVDDIYLISDILPIHITDKYSLNIIESDTSGKKDPLVIGYIKLSEWN